ncbi:hypothetical protein [Streptomyces sp. NPDC127092]|uniref:hypothetical protein n=1 Tax=Streptomyces sp. NPDC127092 TaxID=3347135 RepID=UPI003649F06F
MPIPLPPRRRRGALIAGRAAVVLLMAVLAQGCSLAPVMSEADFREHLRLTEAAGEDAVRRLGMDPAARIDYRQMANASCKDDLGADPEGVTRDRPTVAWVLHFENRTAYGKALDTLRGHWSEQGLEVMDLPAPATGEPGAGFPGLQTTDDDHGVGLSLRPDRYTGETTLVADGGCVRHEGYVSDWE